MQRNIVIIKWHVYDSKSSSSLTSKIVVETLYSSQLFTMRLQIVVLLQLANIYSEIIAKTIDSRNYVSSIFESLGYSTVCVASTLASCERFAKPDCYLHVLYLLPELKALLQETKCNKREIKNISIDENQLNNVISQEEMKLFFKNVENEISERNKFIMDNWLQNLTTFVDAFTLQLQVVENNFIKTENSLKQLFLKETALEAGKCTSVDQLTNTTAFREVIQEIEQLSQERENKTFSLFTSALQDIKSLLIASKPDHICQNNGTLEACMNNLTFCNTEVKEQLKNCTPLTGGSKKDNGAKDSSNKDIKRPRNCGEIFLLLGDSKNGVRNIYPYDYNKDKAEEVVCDHTIDGKGWTVFQNRDVVPTRQGFYGESLRRTFERNWSAYVRGFGDLNGEFWLGLDIIHALVNSSMMKLRVDLEDYEGVKRFAKYGIFSIGDSSSKYTMKIGKYSGDAGDSLANHNGMMFSTQDQDNDRASESCAKKRRGAWWYNACYDSNLNGYQHVGKGNTNYEGIAWRSFRDVAYSLKKVSMKIRPIIDHLIL